ncbi:MAG: hypothetical protein WC805_03100 [Patescibacteria group bacterium]|jgi:hypothetical protein
MKLNTHGTGMTLGAFFALFHFVWLLIVGLGWAKGLMDWVLSLHMMGWDGNMLPFAWGAAILLLIVTFVVGYIWGWVFAYLWNYFHKK